MSEVLIRAKAISKNFQQGSSQLHVLKGIDLTITKGDAVCIRGASGAGKSTLLHILGTLDRPSGGDLYFKDQLLNRLSEDELADFRGARMGFIFQFHHLMSEFTAVENVAMPLRLAGASRSEAGARAARILDELGLRDRKAHFPSELSGGEQQRVAIARALVREPEILFADEPTGSLDSVNSKVIQDLLFELKEQKDLTLVVVSHDNEFSKRFPRVLAIKDGVWAT
jgi:lipoprotein-releasing system ATP-binding protein